MSRYPIDWHALPARHLPLAFHVGTLNGALTAPPPTRSGSYEGPGLSISRCPRAWARIARLGGHTTYALRRCDGAPGWFLDRHALSPTQRRALTGVALSAGLLQPTPVFIAEHFDDEMGCTLRSTFHSLPAALREAVADAVAAADPDGDAILDAASGDFLAAVLASRLATAMTLVDAGAATATILGTPPDAPDAEPARVAVCRGWAATVALTAWWGAHFTTPLDPGSVEEAAWLHLVGTASPFDGVWWEDDDDPVRLSAPRGVIVPRALGAWSYSVATAADLSTTAGP